MARVHVPTSSEQNAALRSWICDRITPRPTITEGECIAIVSDDGSRLYAGAIYHDWRPDTGLMELTAGSKAPGVYWAKPDVLAAMLHYPFRQLGVRKLVVHIPEGNERAQRFAKGAGMVRECLLRHHYGWKQHAIVWSMMDREYARSRFAIEERKAA